MTGQSAGQLAGQLAAPLELTVMMYHYVRDVLGGAMGARSAKAIDAAIPGMPLRRFKDQLDELARRHSMVSWAEVRSALLDERALPPNACLLTFDDGVCDHYLNVFPLLRARGLAGLFFVIARQAGEGLPLPHKLHFLLQALGLERMRAAVWQRLDSQEREAYRQAESRYPARWGEAGMFKTVLQREYSDRAEPWLSALFAEHVGNEAELAAQFFLSPAQAREMVAGGMHIGGHSHSHPWFDWIGPDQLEAEIAASAAWLADVEQGPWAFAYPYGGLNPAAPGLLAKHGFAAAFTTVEQVRHTSAYFIGRLDGEDFALEPARVRHA